MKNKAVCGILRNTMFWVDFYLFLISFLDLEYQPVEYRLGKSVLPKLLQSNITTYLQNLSLTVWIVFPELPTYIILQSLLEAEIHLSPHSRAQALHLINAQRMLIE